MAVIEYKMHRIEGGHRREVPGFVGSRGNWHNTADHTYIGWIDDDRDYFVPDEIVELTKAEFVTRQLAIHAATPFRSEPSDDGPDGDPMTDAEVTTMMETWYDEFVAENS